MRFGQILLVQLLQDQAVVEVHTLVHLVLDLIGKSIITHRLAAKNAVQVFFITLIRKQII
jgi:hypothetical protein